MQQLTWAEKARIYDKALLMYRQDKTLTDAETHHRATLDFQAVLKRVAAGDTVEVPPPVKRRSTLNPPAPQNLPPNKPGECNIPSATPAP